MKTLILIPLLALTSCASKYIEVIIDTSEAVPAGPDRIRAPSSAVTPVIAKDAVNELVEAGNRQLSEIIIRATK